MNLTQTLKERGQWFKLEFWLRWEEDRDIFTTLDIPWILLNRLSALRGWPVWTTRVFHTLWLLLGFNQWGALSHDQRGERSGYLHRWLLPYKASSGCLCPLTKRLLLLSGQPTSPLLSRPRNTEWVLISSLYPCSFGCRDGNTSMPVDPGFRRYSAPTSVIGLFVSTPPQIFLIWKFHLPSCWDLKWHRRQFLSTELGRFRNDETDTPNSGETH